MRVVPKSEYAITAVKYDSEEKHINEVEVRDLPTRNSSRMRREVVVSYLDIGVKFITYTYDEGHWIRGAEVIPVPVNGVTYIKTEQNSTEKDNLGDLPKY